MNQSSRMIASPTPISRVGYQSFFWTVNRAAIRSRCLGLCLCVLLLHLPAGPSLGAPDILAESVEYATGDGYRITADYYRPESASSEVLLLFHDESGSRADWARLASCFASAGFHVVAPDIRGHGGSTFEGDLKGIQTAPTRDGWECTSRDGQAALRFVEGRIGRAVKVLVIGGAGDGAATAVLTSFSLETDPTSLLLLSPGLEPGGVRILPILEGIPSPCLVVADRRDPKATAAARALYRSSKGSCHFWEVEGRPEGGATALIRDPQFCADLCGWVEASVHRARGSAALEIAP